MESSLISKVEKARQYAETPDVFTFQAFQVAFHGTHHEHVVRFGSDGFQCDCEYAQGHEACSHVMALERILQPLLPHTKGG